MASVFQELDKIVRPSSLVDDGVPAVSVAILENGLISSHVISGTKQVDTSTVFQACSISKAITALAVAKLIDQGTLSYDTKIMHHLPDDILSSLTGPNTRPLLPQITLSHLLSHTAGISHGSFIGYPTNVPNPTLTQLMKGEHPSNSTALRLISPPGSQFSYSGGGYCLLQHILTTLLKKPFSELMHDIVLSPLKMTRSHFGPLPHTEKNFSPAYHTALAPSASPYHVLVEEAAAALWTTPSDLLLAISAIQTSLKGAPNAFLSQNVAKEMLSTVKDLGDMGQMANGWVKREDMFGHNGSNFPGYRCMLAGTEDGTERGVAIMTGSQYGIEVCSKVCQAVAFLRGWRAVEVLGGNEWVPYAAKERREGDGKWKEWVGSWEEGWRVIDDGGEAKVGFAELPLLRMVPAATPSVGGAIVFVVEDLRLEVTLATDKGEKVVKLLQGLESPDRPGSRKTLNRAK